tara:strand:+ start:605 stop:2278 length:1674 start_codon:yes stop_codon:yes gene_type:complete
MDLNKEDSSINSEKSIDELIDLKQLFLTLKRNKHIVGFFTSAGILLGFYFALSTERTWQGDFQIVLENSKQDEINTSNKLVQSRLMDLNKNKLLTEIEILKSPSVLINIFEFVKAKRIEQGDSSAENMRFPIWKNSLDVDLSKGTSVLNISYKDKNEKLILPVLKRISETYQDYSGSKRLNNIKMSIDYYKNQINYYKERSSESLWKAQEFALDQDLTSFKGFNKSSDPSSTFESIIFDAINQIKDIDAQLEKLKEIKSEDDEIIYIAAKSDELLGLRFSERLYAIDSKLASLIDIYKSDDQEITNTLQERTTLVNLISRKYMGILNAKRQEAQAILKASERPKGTLIKYRQLINEAQRDASTLNVLENQYRDVLLEGSRIQKPWDLITKPTLIPHPVAPNRKSIVFLGFMAGLISGFISAIAYEKKDNKIFSVREIESISPWRVLEELSTKASDDWTQSIKLVVSQFLPESDSSLALIKIGQIESSDLSLLSSEISKSSPKLNIVITDELIEAYKYKNLILVIALGFTRKKEIENISKKLLIHRKNIIGCIVLNNL